MSDQTAMTVHHALWSMPRGIPFALGFRDSNLADALGLESRPKEPVRNLLETVTIGVLQGNGPIAAADLELRRELEDEAHLFEQGEQRQEDLTERFGHVSQRAFVADCEGGMRVRAVAGLGDDARPNRSAGEPGKSRCVAFEKPEVSRLVMDPCPDGDGRCHESSPSAGGMFAAPEPTEGEALRGRDGAES